MPKFEEKYIRRLWNEELIGKRVFYADSIPKLEKYVETNDERFIGTIVGTHNTTYSFHIEDHDNYMFVYFDPYLELKIAYEKGYRILCLHTSDIWVIVENPDWSYPPECYRVQQDFMEYRRFATGRQIAEWLEKGAGEIRTSKYDVLSSIYEKSDKPVSDVLLRKYEHDTWNEPTLGYLGLAKEV